MADGQLVMSDHTDYQHLLGFNISWVQY
jgi:hypothetical protein